MIYGHQGREIALGARLPCLFSPHSGALADISPKCRGRKNKEDFDLRKAFIFSTLAAVVLMNTPAMAQSFNCRYAKSPDEMAICHNPKLGRLDEIMARNYFRLANRLRRDSDFETLDRFKQNQRAFLQRRRLCGYASGCLRRVYRRRIGNIRDVLYDY